MIFRSVWKHIPQSDYARALLRPAPLEYFLGEPHVSQLHVLPQLGRILALGKDKELPSYLAKDFNECQ